jgi:hypothetical protein
MRWVEKYNDEGEIKRHDRPPVAYKINKNEVKYILDEIKKNKTITMEELLIKVNETSIKCLQKRQHCYSEMGKRCVIKTTSQEVFKKYTGIFAITSKGVIEWDLYEKGGINTDRLIKFLEKNITSKLKIN